MRFNAIWSVHGAFFANLFIIAVFLRGEPMAQNWTIATGILCLEAWMISNILEGRWEYFGFIFSFLAFSTILPIFMTFSAQQALQAGVKYFFPATILPSLMIISITSAKGKMEIPKRILFAGAILFAVSCSATEHLTGTEFSPEMMTFGIVFLYILYKLKDAPALNHEKTMNGIMDKISKN